MFELHQGDAVQWLRSLPAGSVDLVITDPPYESLEKHRRIGTTTRLKHSKSSSNDWFSIFPNNRFEELFVEIFRVLKKNAHFYLFCDAETMFVAKPLAEAAGFRFWKPIIWDKVAIGMGYHYRARCERILFFEKGKRKLANLGTPDVLEFKRVHRGYPTEKPVALLEVLVNQSSSEGEVVLDPFMGSGSTGVAAVANGRGFLGNDISAGSTTVASGRLADYVDQTQGQGMAAKNAYGGRIQAQGRDIIGKPHADGDTISVAWDRPTPPTCNEGLTYVDEVEELLPKKPRQRRAEAFKRARRAIRRFGRAGGTPPQPFRPMSFYVESPAVKEKSARVDISVDRGTAFQIPSDSEEADG